MKKAPLRKLPTQDRSKQRVARILDAAGEVFGEVGYDAATTEAIAARAEVSIGSLYQFFPNKSALFMALAQRYHEREIALSDALFTEEMMRLPWPELMERAIDGFYALHKNDPVLRVILQSVAAFGEVLQAGEALNRDLARRAEQVLAFHAPKAPPATRALVARVVVETLTAMLFLAAREPEKGDQYMQEAKSLVYRYLLPYAEKYGRKAPANKNRSR